MIHLFEVGMVVFLIETTGGFLYRIHKAVFVYEQISHDFVLEPERDFANILRC